MGHGFSNPCRGQECPCSCFWDALLFLRAFTKIRTSNPVYRFGSLRENRCSIEQYYDVFWKLRSPRKSNFVIPICVIIQMSTINNTTKFDR